MGVLLYKQTMSIAGLIIIDNNDDDNNRLP
jgi:hypothetical protein